jgi:2-(1,2-epoxy-1,2-dihydrophenyl)acetyl-CoA isomerase
MSGAFDTVALEIADHVATVTLNRPDTLNAFTIGMVDELQEALRLVSGSAEVRCVVLTGAGRAFCAGADLAELQDIHDRKDEARGRRLVDGSREVHRLIRGAPQPVIAALNGVAAGGGANLALGCDLRIAADTARIGQVFAKLGLHPDWGGSYFLPRMVGTARALELFLSAELVEAPRLLALGLVNRVVPAADLAAEARAWARRIAAAPPVAVRWMKRGIYASERATLEEVLDYELDAQLALFRSDDFTEGLAAFRAKREPQFTGRQERPRC